MQSKAKTVDDYLEEVPENRRVALTKLRDLCVKHLTGYQESMRYGGPSYEKNGEVELGFASQKNYIGFYVLKQDVLAAHKAELTGASSIGKGAIRFSSPKKIDFDVIKKLIIGTRKSKAPIC